MGVGLPQHTDITLLTTSKLLFLSLSRFLATQNMDFSEKEVWGAPGGSVDRAGAPYTEAMSSPQRTRVRFHLWPFAACHSPSLSPVSCPLFSCPVLIKAQKAQKNNNKKKKK